MRDASLTGREITFSEDDLIVSKTDPRGIITYVNDVFCKVSGYHEEETLDKPHSLIRHPHMPRCVFKLLWDELKAGNEVFAYVLNRAKNGDEYWVFAHVTPTYDDDGKLLGYHSSRRSPRRSAIEKIKPIYRQLLECEHQLGSLGQEALAASTKMLQNLLESHKITYPAFVLGLE